MRYGELIETQTGYALTFTRHLNHPPERVWRALLEPDDLKAWFPTTIEGEQRAGAPLTFTFHGGEADPVEGEMLAYDPPRLLEFSWGEGDTMRFELEPDGEGTTLTLINRFAERGKAARDAAGWHACLEALRARLDGDAPAEEWADVHPRYVEAFPPEASTVGPPGA